MSVRRGCVRHQNARERLELSKGAAGEEVVGELSLADEAYTYDQVLGEKIRSMASEGARLALACDVDLGDRIPSCLDQVGERDHEPHVGSTLACHLAAARLP